MPNWCTNDLELWIDESDPEAMKQKEDFEKKSIITETYVNDDGTTGQSDKLTFEGVIPMPRTLKITAGTSTDEAVMYLKAKEGDIKELKKAIKSRTYLLNDGVFNKSDKLSVKVEKYLKYLEDKIEVNALTEGRLAIENEKKHGAQDWYSWSIRNWGTKWDAGQLNHLDSYEGNLILCFDTAWSPPIPWLEKVTEKYPLLTIKMRVTEESDAFIGIITARGGNVIPNIVDVDYPE